MALFGNFEVKMKAAGGRGIVSSIVLQSDVLDEVDWEFIGGEDYRVQSNYFVSFSSPVAQAGILSDGGDLDSVRQDWWRSWFSLAVLF